MLGTLSAAEIEDLLRSEVVARVGCQADGRVYIVPITYAYDGESLIAHSAEGLKLRIMRANPQVCVEVDRVDNLAEWRSVIAQGRFEELRGANASAALVQLRERFRPLLVVSETSQPSDGLHEGESLIHRGNGGARLYRIHLFDKTGRFERP
jgi:nitroimidazol reductase NimA-like FMN-containing flavoprotein (pyridoxamine 5'-phosphate oxidase superfamily)